jgi:sugar lactone lactonase YvrE
MLEAPMAAIINSCYHAIMAAILFAVAVLTAARPTFAQSLVEIYSNPDFQITGVTVSKGNRIFANFPRWSDHYQNAVVEIASDGSAKPFPDEYWNRWSGKASDAGAQFVCVQSVVADDQNVLWVVDPAAPLLGPIVEGGAKLVAIDLGTNRVKRIYRFGADVVKPNTYLNDVRIDNSRHTAYMTDSGVGGIIVLDLDSGKARRVLDGHPSVLAEPGVQLTMNGKTLLGPDGKSPQMHSDGIALSADGQYLYYQALTSKTLYRIKTETLRSADTSSASAAVERVAGTFPVDGLWIDGQSNIYLSALEQQAVVRLSPDGKMKTVIKDPRLQWPDTFSEGPDGSVFITASHINESPRFNEGKEVRKQPYAIFRFQPQTKTSP